MARPLRIEYEGAVYHITARGNERGKIFFNRKDYEKFKEYVAEAQEKYRFLLHAYVLMTNHYHLLVETPEKNLSKIMHHINSSYTTYINIKRKRSGHLFQGRYKAIIVDKDNYLLELSRYIHLNPVRVNMVERPEEHSHSSYKSYITGKAESFVNSDAILQMLAKDEKQARERYRLFVEGGLGGEEGKSLLNKVYGGIILGGEGFIGNVLAKLESDALENTEVSHRKALQATAKTGEIIAAVCDHYGISHEEIKRNKRSEARKACIYLLKKYTCASNNEIGELFGKMTYSAVAKTYQGFIKQMEEDGELGKRIKGILTKNSFFKG